MNIHLDWLGDSASPFFEWLLRASFQACIIMGLVLILQVLLKDRLSARWRHALWLIVLLRLLVPHSIESRLSVFNLFPAKHSVTARQAAQANSVTVAPDPSLQPEPNEGVRVSERSIPTLATLLPLVWLGGVICIPAYILAASWRLGRKVRSQRPTTSEAILNLVEDCKQEMGVNTPLTLIETSAVRSPCLFGCIRPRLLLPAGFTNSFAPAEMRYVFLHELGHIKRQDIPLGWLTTAALVLHWFNPAVWLAVGRMRADGELACDALALSRAKGAENRGYGQTMIKLLEQFSQPARTPDLVGILENKNHMKRRISMIAKFKQNSSSPWLAAGVFAALACFTLSNPRAGQAAPEPLPAETAAPEPGGPPKIIATSPEVGATEVDPSTREITVTFDRDMGGGMSWTGGPPDFPPGIENKKAQWRDKRTCVLPVKLEAAKYYRVGINSTSYRNFKSSEGIPSQPSAIYFTTKGASDALKKKATKPMIVAINPKNGAKDVDPGLKELRVSFNVPMGGGFSWTGGGPEFPGGVEGKKPFWTDDKKTCVLPVTLEPGKTYRLGLNSPSHKNFQSSGGVPLDPVVYSFTTKN